jgi:hypothetical protein
MVWLTTIVVIAGVVALYALLSAVIATPDDKRLQPNRMSRHLD